MKNVLTTERFSASADQKVTVAFITFMTCPFFTINNINRDSTPVPSVAYREHF